MVLSFNQAIELSDVKFMQEKKLTGKIYGAGNVSKMLQQLPVQTRAEAVESLSFEAKCRVEDPVYGCVGIISLLQTEIQKTQTLLARTQAEIAVAQAKHSQTQVNEFM
uniref:LOB domain-containing protein n=1 Tax=Brassica campestris TaxID=3711 RepID=M4E8W1_BRACM